MTLESEEEQTVYKSKFDKNLDRDKIKRHLESINSGANTLLFQKSSISEHLRELGYNTEADKYCECIENAIEAATGIFLSIHSSGEDVDGVLRRRKTVKHEDVVRMAQAVASATPVYDPPARSGVGGGDPGPGTVREILPAADRPSRIGISDDELIRRESFAYYLSQGYLPSDATRLANGQYPLHARVVPNSRHGGASGGGGGFSASERPAILLPERTATLPLPWDKIRAAAAAAAAAREEETAKIAKIGAVAVTAESESASAAAPVSVPAGGKELGLERSEVVILRGLPGSGKDWSIPDIVQRFKDENGVLDYTGFEPWICSADKWFLKPEGYMFDAGQLGRAHSECLNEFLSGLQIRYPLILINNTNTQRWEFENYAAIALKFGAKVTYKTLHKNARELSVSDLAVFAKRNKHGVPFSTICAMADKWEE